MASTSVRHMFGNFTFSKTIPEILEAVEKKVAALKSKITERENRIIRIRKEFDITDADLISLLSQAAQQQGRHVANSYNLNSTTGETKVIGAGVVQNVLTEQSEMAQEKEAVDRLLLIKRNLRPVPHYADDGTVYMQESFTLADAEIEYLGF